MPPHQDRRQLVPTGVLVGLALVALLPAAGLSVGEAVLLVALAGTVVAAYLVRHRVRSRLIYERTGRHDGDGR